MLAFSRLTSLPLFLLSLGFLASALPTPQSKALSHRDYSPGPAVVDPADLIVKVHAQVGDIVNIDLPAVVDVNVLLKVEAKVKEVTEIIRAIAACDGLTVDLTAQLGATIAVLIKAIVKLIVHIVLDLKLHISVDIIAKLNLCIKALLDAIIKIDGLLSVVIKLLVDLDTKVLVQLKLDSLVGLIKGVLGGILGLVSV